MSALDSVPPDRLAELLMSAASQLTASGGRRGSFTPTGIPIREGRLHLGRLLLRRPPAGTFPLGRAAGRRRLEELFIRMQSHAPDVFDSGDLSLHSYRHALGTFTDGRYGRAVTRAVLGHSSRRTPTDHYVHVPIEQVAGVLADYEAHLLSWDRAPVIPIESAGDHRRAASG
jgi:integrase